METFEPHPLRGTDRRSTVKLERRCIQTPFSNFDWEHYQHPIYIRKLRTHQPHFPHNPLPQPQLPALPHPTTRPFLLPHPKNAASHSKRSNYPCIPHPTTRPFLLPHPQNTTSHSKRSSKPHQSATPLLIDANTPNPTTRLFLLSHLKNTASHSKRSSKPHQSATPLLIDANTPNPTTRPFLLPHPKNAASHSKRSSKPHIPHPYCLSTPTPQTRQLDLSCSRTLKTRRRTAKGRTTLASRTPQLDLSSSRTLKTRRRTAKGRTTPASRTPKTRRRTAKGRVRAVRVLRIPFSPTFDLVVGLLLFAQQNFGDLTGDWGWLGNFSTDALANIFTKIDGIYK
ncbi:hypothetical protein CFELI_01580 [Corynebacterium felinum]|uniref:Uncharacterized protein n=1 Tax=Corynebacterium felinum TaxID=131318 RepID=A0ABU2B7K6_9CORY|nr:hypothetical protein [Corynebacterium felinum]WJY93959.1 hypothetical protein CFELI_01580 [Corynebacterium felinum]